MALTLLGAEDQSSFEPKRVSTLDMDPKVLYLSFWGAGSSRIKKRVDTLVEKTEINAVVIDIKNEYGYLSYQGNIPEAKTIGAYRKKTIEDLRTLIQEYHDKGVYVIGRMVVFKDNLFARAHPDSALRNHKGIVWNNNENLAWTNPASPAVQNYNVDIAAEAAAMGFDEINFDYIRFPATKTISFGMPNTEKNRVAAIEEFLSKAKIALKPMGVLISVDTYGYVCWNTNDTGIGQRLDVLGKYADIICPMLYPSGFHLGIPNYEKAMENIYEIIYYSLETAHIRSGIPRKRFRPWLQAFRDYSFDKRYFKADEIREQISAAENFGSGGWFLWHPGSYFVADGLQAPQPERTEVVSNNRIAPETVLELKETTR